jgi:hypothetical protein
MLPRRHCRRSSRCLSDSGGLPPGGGGDAIDDHEMSDGRRPIFIGFRPIDDHLSLVGRGTVSEGAGDRGQGAGDGEAGDGRVMAGRGVAGHFY